VSAPAASLQQEIAEGIFVPQWPAPGNVRALITTRNGGVSSGPYASFNLGAGSGDDAAAVAENRARLRRFLPGDPVWLKQVHGTAVADADARADSAGEVEADAAVARGVGVVCAVLAADCLPVLLADTAGSVVGAAHAGWRGLAAGVVEHAIAAMQVDPSTLVAYLGPCISGAHFEVGADVRDAFCNGDAVAAAAFAPKTNGKWLADLPMLASQRLLRAGVSQHSIFGSGACTYAEPARFHSYRRDGASGRMAALIWRAQASA
jgi:YfiH family protein